MTNKNIYKIISDYNDICSLAAEYIKETFPNNNNKIRIKDGIIEEYVNTACHCHPEYTWEYLSTIESFNEWVIENNK